MGTWSLVESKLATFKYVIIEKDDETRKLQEQLTKITDQCKEILNNEARLDKAIQ